MLRDTSASVQTLLVLGGGFMQSVDMGYQTLCRSYLQKTALDRSITVNYKCIIHVLPYST